jgi:hypothetical protein
MPKCNLAQLHVMQQIKLADQEKSCVILSLNGHTFVDTDGTASFSMTVVLDGETTPKGVVIQTDGAWTSDVTIMTNDVRRDRFEQEMLEAIGDYLRADAGMSINDPDFDLYAVMCDTLKDKPIAGRLRDVFQKRIDDVSRILDTTRRDIVANAVARLG